MLLIGAVAGWLAGLLMRGGGFGLLGNIVVGIIGAFVGGYLFGLVGLSAGSGLVGSLITAIAAGVVANEMMHKEDDKSEEASSTVVASAAATPNRSFDCAKASHEIEELICKDAELADLDRSLADLYAVVLKNTPASEQKTLTAEQRGWVKGRNDCWKSSDERGCVKREYEARISELKDR